MGPDPLHLPPSPKSGAVQSYLKVNSNCTKSIRVTVTCLKRVGAETSKQLPWSLCLYLCRVQHGPIHTSKASLPRTPLGFKGSSMASPLVWSAPAFTECFIPHSKSCKGELIHASLQGTIALLFYREEGEATCQRQCRSSSKVRNTAPDLLTPRLMLLPTAYLPSH